MCSFSFWFVFLTCTTCWVLTARVLLVFPLPERSHYILGSSLAKGLAEKGHDVTMVSPFAEKNPKGSYRDIQLTGLFEHFQAKLEKNEYNFFDLEVSNPFLNAIRLAMTCTEVEEVFEHENFKKFLHSNETFDIVITEQFLNNALQALSTYFKAPLIVFSSIGADFWVNSLSANPSPTACIPDIMLSYSSQMTFFERLVNTFVYLTNEVVYKFYVYPKQNEIIKKYIPNGPHIDEVLYNASIILLNSHVSTNQPVPHVPNLIEIGGFHVQPPKKLPDDLQGFLDGAPDGVIYFSMGSNIRSAQFPVDKLQALVKAFSKLKQKVLWKWEEDDLPGKPSNVKIQKWLPQQSILAHPNVKLFITHGGLLSTTEAVYHGVPILAIPIFGDQKVNARLAVNGGYGLLLGYNDISEETVTEKIRELLENSKYNLNAKTRSKIFHDRPVSPMDTAIYWVEYVIRHGGAPHLRVAGLDLLWYQYFLLDVVAVVAVVASLGLLILWLLVKKTCRLYSKRAKKGKTD